MGPAIVILGGILGVFTAIAGLVFLDLSILSAVAIWAASGPISALALFIPTGSAPAPAPNAQTT